MNNVDCVRLFGKFEPKWNIPKYGNQRRRTNPIGQILYECIRRLRRLCANGVAAGRRRHTAGHRQRSGALPALGRRLRGRERAEGDAQDQRRDASVAGPLEHRGNESCTRRTAAATDQPSEGT